MDSINLTGGSSGLYFPSGFFLGASQFESASVNASMVRAIYWTSRGLQTSAIFLSEDARIGQGYMGGAAVYLIKHEEHRSVHCGPKLWVDLLLLMSRIMTR